VTCLLGIWIAAAEAQDLTIEGHIRQVTDELLPAAIVRGQEALKMSILDEMKTLHVTGVSIAVIHDGKIESPKSYGAKRLDGDPVTTETPFQAGSISKPIAAIAALRLVREGGLFLDQNVNDLLTSWRLSENSFTAKSQ
jgi:CubicO group peptidase (beta-lactamase class C family)